jgi:hypothetical protein
MSATDSPFHHAPLDLIRVERERQDEKWGEQNHRDGTGYSYERDRENYRKACQQAAAEGVVAWVDILLEEVYEAAAETDPEKLATELIEVAAVAVQWFDAIVRRHQPEPQPPPTPLGAWPDETKAELSAMYDEMEKFERDPLSVGVCTCGYPVQPCLRMVFRNGPPWPPRPCEPKAKP